MARFKQTFRVNASLQTVWELHDDAATLTALTPPPLTATLIHVDKPFKQGSQVKFKLGIAGLGVIWDARYDEYHPYVAGEKQCWFVDRAAKSPFHKWSHRHTFVDNGDGTTNCTDDATFELVGGPLSGVITAIFAYLPIVFLFTFRRMKTYSLLNARLKAR